MKNNIGAWRGGTDSKARSHREQLLRVWTTETSQRYGINGAFKHGKRAPKPVTLPKIELKEIKE